jgi:outer membrane protein OmpA-like peptidoglycan-associated protein
VNFNRVENNPFTGDDPGPTLNLEGVYDFTLGDWAYGLNAGYRKRDPGTQIPGIPIEPYDDSLIFSAAASRYLTKYDLKLIAEVFSSFPLHNTAATTDRELSTVELLLGAKKDLRHDLALHFGGGTELYQGSSTADWRLYAGLNWNMGPLWGEQEREGARTLSPESALTGSRPLTTSEKFLVGDVLFAYDSDQISEAFKEVLKDLAGYLKSGSFKELVVEGHTDSVGSEQYNQGLSERRAASVVKYLRTEGGLPAAKLKSVGYGETRPVADNANYQGRAKNRRVEFNVTR